MKIKRFLVGVAFATICGVGGYASVKIFATEPTTEPTTVVTTEDTTTTAQQKEKITFEYYTITEEAAKNGWVCHTVGRCDKNKIMVYIYDPAVLGIHKFNVVAGFEFLQADFTFIFVNEYNDVLGEVTKTYETDAFNSGVVIVIDDYPPGTKYVKFKDITNIIKKDS